MPPTLVERKGDLFQLAPPHAALAHCVSQDLHMGRGIATHFRDTYGRVGQLRQQDRHVGQTAVLYPASASPPAIFYLVTKPRYFHKPTMATLQAALEDMRATCLSHSPPITAVAMPRIGCGLDKLNWGEVRDLLLHVFRDDDMSLHIYYI